MSEEEKIEINNLKRTLEIHHINNEIIFKMENMIQKQQKEIEKKDKEIAELKKSNEQMNNNFSDLMHIL